MTLFACGIDIGYGNTKFTTGTSDEGEILTGIFPSTAPFAGKGIGIDLLEEKECIVVPGLGNDFHYIGADSVLHMGQNSGRILNNDFSIKSEYAALLNGALHHIGVPVIDCLVVGLPVNVLSTLSAAVAQLAAGLHKLPFGDIFVKDVKVVAQPVGGLFDFAYRNNKEKSIKTGFNLLIDPGYFTMDWVVAKGLKVIAERSGSANNSGMAAILNIIMTSVVDNIGKRDQRPTAVTEYLLGQLDFALRTGAPFEINGRVENLKPHLGAADRIIAGALNKIMSSIGAASEINNVIVVGGTSHLFKNQISNIFAGYSVKVAKNPEFSNVRGFHLLAEQALKRGV